ncbi:MAG: hypothetical protein EOO40_09560, partial [Deltaproteobacteria bacterium]
MPAALFGTADVDGSVQVSVSKLSLYFDGMLERIVGPSDDDFFVNEDDLFDRSKLSVEQHVVLNDIESMHQANLTFKDVREAAKLLKVPVEVLSMHLATRAGEMELEQTVRLVPKKSTCVAPRSASQRNKAFFQPTLNSKALGGIK